MYHSTLDLRVITKKQDLFALEEGGERGDSHGLDHPKPYTLHPTPYTLHPCTQHSKTQSLKPKDLFALEERSDSHGVGRQPRR